MSSLLRAFAAVMAVTMICMMTMRADAGGCHGAVRLQSNAYYQDVVVAQPVVVAVTQPAVQYTERVTLPAPQHFVQHEYVKECVNCNRSQQVILQNRASYGYNDSQTVILQNKHRVGARQQVQVDTGATRTRVRTATRPIRRNVAVTTVNSY